MLYELRRRMHSGRGVSPVIATIILSAAVITIGAAVWNYAQGAATIIANDYVNGTLDLLNELTERFIVEHVCNESDGSVLHVWVYNYGDVDIVVDVYVNATHYNQTTEEYEYLYEASYSNSVALKSVSKINVTFSSRHLVVGDYVSIKVHSWRQNNAYCKYYL